MISERETLFTELRKTYNDMVLTKLINKVTIEINLYTMCIPHRPR